MEYKALFRTTNVFCSFLILVTISGCSIKTYSKLEPVQPQLRYFCGLTETVDSLKPKFVWSKDTTPGVKYDFALFNMPKLIGTNAITNTTTRKYGEPIYYKEGLGDNEHVVDKELSENTKYSWSVRTRIDDKFSEWSTFNCYFYGILAAGNSTNVMFHFKTPDGGK